MQKILLFDIDGTLFDPKTFLSELFNEAANAIGIGSKDEFLTIYQQVRDEANYFIPEKFIDALMNRYQTIDRQRLEEIFWNVDLYKKSVYKDTSALNNLSQNAMIGVFSKGEEKFQNHKLALFGNLFNKENIYIYPDKLAHIDEVIQRYRNYEIVFIDNRIQVLEAIEKSNPGCKLVLIDRIGDMEDNKNVIKIKSLEELENLI